MFRAVFDDEGHHLVDNFREPQSLHDRVILYRSDGRDQYPKKSGGGSVRLRRSENLLICFILLSLVSVFH